MSMLTLDESPTVRLVETMFADESSRQIYTEILSLRVRLSIDPDYTDYANHAISRDLAARYVLMTERYIRLSAQLIERIAAGKEIDFDRGVTEHHSDQDKTPSASDEALRNLITTIWTPRPDAPTSDFYYLEMLCAAVMSNQLVAMLADFARDAARQADIHLEPPMTLVYLEALIKPVLGSWQAHLSAMFRPTFLTPTACSAIKLVGSRMAEQRIANDKGGLERNSWFEATLEPAPTEVHAPLFDIAYKGDADRTARDAWLAAKKTPALHTNRSAHGSRRSTPSTPFSAQPARAKHNA